MLLRIGERSATVAPMSEPQPRSARHFVLALVFFGAVAVAAISASAIADPGELLAAVTWIRASGPLGALVFVLAHAVAILTFVPSPRWSLSPGLSGGPCGARS